jgi:lipopolysaccharide/colanic/teichoic acid biosynthesis glycosyltransferase
MIALAVKVSSPGPVIFKQVRIGLKGVRFVLYKFRSMNWNADDQIHREYIAVISGRLGN